MSISFYPYVLREDGWSWPDGVRDRMDAEIVPAYDSAEYEAWMDGDLDCRNPNYDQRLDLNLATRNAQFVLNELGLLTGSGFDEEPVPIDAFEIGLRATMDRNPDPIPGLDGYDSQEPGRCRVISAGVPDGYANRIFERLLLLVGAARAYGATHIGWG